MDSIFWHLAVIKINKNFIKYKTKFMHFLKDLYWSTNTLQATSSSFP